MSSNGLIAPTDVCRNANPESAFFVRVGQPIAVPSPFQLVSASGVEVTSITVDASGNTIIDSAEAVTVSNGLGVVSGDIAIQVGSLTVVTGGIGVEGEILCNGGISNSGAPITSSSQNIVANEAEIVVFDGVQGQVKLGSINQEIVYTEYTGDTNDGPVYRTAVGGGSAQAPFEGNVFGIYGTQGGVSPFEARLTVDLSGAVVIPGSLTVAGKPIAKAEYKPYVGVVGLSIQVPTPGSIQQISEDFSVIANHTYKISMQARIISGDTNAGAFVALICKTPDSSVGLGEEEGGPSFDSGNTRGFFGTFKAPASANNCKVEVLNGTIASVVIQLALTDISVNPGVLIEDLGIL